MQSRLRHSSLGMVIGVPFGGGGGWNPTKTMHITSRSGNILVDAKGNDANILLPYFYKPLKGRYASISDNGALDIGNTYDFSMYVWVKNETATTGTTRGLIGKYNGSVSGGYGIGLGSTNGLYAIIRTSTNYFLAYDAGNIITLGSDWTLVGIEIEQATKAFRLFINGVQNGADTTFTGTFGIMPDVNPFYIGKLGAGFTANSMASFSDAILFRRILTSTEKELLLNRNSGMPVAPLAYYPCVERQNILYDVSGNDYNITKSAVDNGYPQYYASEGSRYCLDYGYTEIASVYGTLNIPLKMDGTAHTISETADFNIIKNIAGSISGHNLADSYIDFVGDEWDRSDVIRYSSLARSLKYKYDALNPKRWTPDLLNNLLFQSWANEGYKGINFVKISDTSYKDRNLLSEIITCSSNQAGGAYSKAMSYCNDFVFDDTYENDFLYWKMTPDLIRAVNGSKYFAYEAGKVKLSIDNGATYPYEKAIAGLTTIHMAWIFANGNILFAALVGGTAKIYYSTDNLVNVTECTVLDVSGNPYSPVNANCYMWATSPIYHTIGTKDMLAWANYNVLNKNSIWYSTDYGVTIKQAYLDGTTDPPNIDADNIHGIAYTGADKKFWIWHGDGTDKCAVIEGTYDDVADTWAWVKIAGDNDGGSSALSNYTYYKIGGFIFDSGYVYWVSDSDNPVRKKIYRCLRADFGVTPANYETLFDNGVFLFDFELFGSDMLTSNLRKTNDEFHWILGLNKTKWYNIPLYNHVITTNYKNQFIFGIDSNGWIVSNAPDYNGSLLTKIK